MEHGIDFSKLANFRSTARKATPYLAGSILSVAALGCSKPDSELIPTSTPSRTPAVTRVIRPLPEFAKTAQVPTRVGTRPASSNPNDYRYELQFRNQKIYTPTEPLIEPNPIDPNEALFIGIDLYCPPQNIPSQTDFCRGLERVAEKGSIINVDLYKCTDRKPEADPPAKNCIPQK